MPLGTWGGYAFPGNDMGWVQTHSNFNIKPFATAIGEVNGSLEAPVGAFVCRSGAETGMHCGTIRSKNATARYALDDGSLLTVNGLTETNVCSESGDSGGPFITGDQAQGITSGGDSRTCADHGDKTYFQPINPVLARYGLTLKKVLAGLAGDPATRSPRPVRP